MITGALRFNGHWTIQGQPLAGSTPDAPEYPPYHAGVTLQASRISVLTFRCLSVTEVGFFQIAQAYASSFEHVESLRAWHAPGGTALKLCRQQRATRWCYLRLARDVPDRSELLLRRQRGRNHGWCDRA